MHLIPSGLNQVVVTPLVIHWAGLGSQRHSLMRRYFARRFHMNFSSLDCLTSSRHDELVESEWPNTYGSNARMVTCCSRLQKWPDRNDWPWTSQHPSYELMSWGCLGWTPVDASRNEGYCTRILAGDVYPGGQMASTVYFTTTAS